MDYKLITGNALDILKKGKEKSIQCVVTSPPYYGLRRYDGGEKEIGREKTVEEYVDNLVKVFREVKRVLRDDGILWLNLGDSYAGSGGAGGDYNEGGLRAGQPKYKSSLKTGRISSNLMNFLQRSVKGQPLIFGDATTIGVTSKSGNIPLQDDGFPYGVLFSLLGIERVTIKQRDNNFCQVLHTLTSPCYCWISFPVLFMTRNVADLEIVLDSGNDISIVISNHDTNRQPVLGIDRVMMGRTSKNDDTSFSIKEAREPVSEIITNTQSFGNPVTFDTTLERFPDVYLVDHTVTLGDAFSTSSSDVSNFCIAKATQKQLTLSLGNYGVDLTAIDVRHLSFLNEFDSVVRYAELYLRAIRKANATQSKQELGIPEMVKRALMEDGWICRQTIIWAKPNPIPESVKDRCTKSHEYIFLFAKSPKYFFDGEAIREPSVSYEDSKKRYKSSFGGSKNQHLVDSSQVNTRPIGMREFDGKRNRRSVWIITTKPFKGSHFAVFPPELIEPCILASTSAYGACKNCKSPWARVVEREMPPLRKVKTNGPVGGHRLLGGNRFDEPIKTTTTGWAATCQCNCTDVVPCFVLDPFSGAATTGVVALKNNRRYIGIDLNPLYNNMGDERIQKEIYGK